MYKPSPALGSANSPYRGNKISPVPHHETANLSIPNIHIFNPGESQDASHQSLENTEDANEPQQSDHDTIDKNTAETSPDAQVQTEKEEERDAVNLKPSIDSYDTAELHNEYSYEECDNTHTQQESGLQYDQYAPTYDDEELQDFATATASESMDYEDPRPVTSHDEGAYETHVDSYQDEFSPQASDHREASPPDMRETIDGNWGARRMAAVPPNVTTSDADPTTSSTVLPSTPSSTILPPTPVALSNFRTPRRDLAVFDDGKETPKSPLEEIFTPEFKMMHKKNIRRRHEFQQNMQNLERRLASLNSNLANMTMEREAKQSVFLRDHVLEPMTEAVERISLERDYQTSPHQLGVRHWMALAARMSTIETEMAQHVHGTLPQLIQDKLDLPHDALIQEDAPAFHLETTKSEKREGSMLRQFEALAATTRRRYHEEHAARCGAFEVLRQQLLTVAKVQRDPARIEEAIVKVKALRAKLEQERAERRRRDEDLVQAVEHDRIWMNRSLLETTADDYDVPPSSVRRAIAYH
jgi:hypothetical protein